MSEFHATKPLLVFRGNNMDVYIESDYPVECFDAPPRFVAYLTKRVNDKKALGANYTKKGLLEELYLWKENPLVFELIEDDIKQFERGDDV